MAQNGIHHVTAIAGHARRNLGFYTRALGLRLVKRTVNFDDPGAYHLYYGDEAGSPGTILTFFPWEHAAPGRAGVGELQETAFRIPKGAIGYWTVRLVNHGPTERSCLEAGGVARGTGSELSLARALTWLAAAGGRAYPGRVRQSGDRCRA